MKYECFEISRNERRRSRKEYRSILNLKHQNEIYKERNVKLVFRVLFSIKKEERGGNRSRSTQYLHGVRGRFITGGREKEGEKEREGERERELHRWKQRWEGESLLL